MDHGLRKPQAVTQHCVRVLPPLRWTDAVLHRGVRKAHRTGLPRKGDSLYLLQLGGQTVRAHL